MNVCVFLAQGFEEIEALATVDVLRRAGINVITVSISNSLQVIGGHDIMVVADKIFNTIDYNTIDMLVLPGGMPGTTNLNSHKELKQLIQDFHKQKKWLAAICAAPMILGNLGILNGEKAVSYPGFESHLTRADVQDVSVVRSNNVITAKGAGVTIYFALEIVEALVSKEKAEELKDKMIVL